MVDTLETAADAQVQITARPVCDPIPKPTPKPAPERVPFHELVAEWRELAATMNDLNRSMGLDDAYPFTLPPAVVDKLRFIHELIGDAA